jgi:hypothetical protein
VGDRERELDENERALAAREGEGKASLAMAEQALRARESNVQTGNYTSNLSLLVAYVHVLTDCL